MNWHTAELGEAALLQECAIRNGFQANNYSAVNSILYARKYGARIALHGGWLYERFDKDGTTAFAFPHRLDGNGTENGLTDCDAAGSRNSPSCGKTGQTATGTGTGLTGGNPERGGEAGQDIKEALNILAAEAGQEGKPLSFMNITAAEKEELCRIFPKARAEARPDMGDYIYLTENLAELPGKKYSRKRNHIHQFVKAHPGCTVKTLGPDTLEAALRVEDGWLHDKKGDAALQEEREIIARALGNFGSFADTCGMTGAVAYEGDEPFAFCVASLLGPSVTDVHFEKCLPDHARDGGYAFINCEFAKKVKSEYINREEDLGLEGLRKAKLSYFPHIILEKFNVYCT
ncbi:MAG: phosphatidylglycerol lysyltransferase domain-containing protein [Treponema sp.]|nr:phosphatidylglycerol lysyltransferase domain-containing protein [Treponema sp.]